MNKPIFYQAILLEITENVLEFAYPQSKGLTLKERLGSENAECSECGKNEWFLLPKESIAVKEGGKPYIECLNCGFQTHL